ncbi:MAG: LysE family translocator [Legionellales bacterium]|jgi:L-lysine exporter family protein LysE/ArgO
MQIVEILFMGILLGWGAAIPIGPINLEMIRRNLNFGTRFSLLFGFGACSADVLYLVLLSYGVLSLLTYPLVLKIIGILGAFVLIYFAYGALTAKPSQALEASIPKGTLLSHYLSGLLLTLSNPITILFWASISSQVVTLTVSHPNALIYAGIGVLMGTVSWVVALNLFLHFTKHKISNAAINMLNKIGGLLLLGFAIFSIYYAI